MELISHYLNRSISIQLDQIHMDSIGNLQDAGWYYDPRGSENYLILHRIMNLEPYKYTVSIRFIPSQTDSGLTLENRIPFMVTRVATSPGSKNQIWHSKKYPGAQAMIDAGVPQAVVGKVKAELSQFLIYGTEKDTRIELQGDTFIASASLISQEWSDQS